MAGRVEIRMLGGFSVSVDGRPVEAALNRTKKGASLMRILILGEGVPVPNRVLLEALWENDHSSNPESALKTLVSRLRSLLSSLSDGLGSCIVADRGAYHWENRPGVSVDLYDVVRLFDRLGSAKTDVRRTPLYRKILEIYRGRLLDGGSNSWVQARATALHNQYLEAVSEYLKLLFDQEDYERAEAVARQALLADELDDRLHISLLASLLKLGRSGEAMNHYRRVKDLHFRYLGMPLSGELLDFYKKIIYAGSENGSQFDLNVIRAGLVDETGDGARVYEYPVFRDLYNSARKTMSGHRRLIWLGALVMGVQGRIPVQAQRQDDLMNSLTQILLDNLNNGDVVTRYSPAVLLVLLWSDSAGTAQEKLEDVRKKFLNRHQNAGLTLSVQAGPIEEGDQ